MDLDDEELKATRKLHNLDNEKTEENIFEDLEILINTFYSNCKNEREITQMAMTISKISYKQSYLRRKELKKDGNIK